MGSPGTVFHHDSRIRTGAAARLTVLVIALGFSFTPLLPAQEWGTRPYEEEKAEYFAVVKQLEREANQLLSRIRQVRNDTDAVLGGFSQAERTRLVQEYERHVDNANRKERHFRAKQKEQAARDLYDDARAVFSAAQERRPEVRANLWTKHIEWRRLRIVTRTAELAWLDSKLVVIQRVVDCLTARGDSIDAPSIIAVLKRDASGYAAFLSDCRADSGLPVDVQRIEQILDRLRALIGSTQSRVAQAEADCALARSGLAATAAPLGDADARLSQLESELTAAAEQAPVGDPVAQASAYDREAYAAASQVVQVKQQVEDSESQACSAADRVATAATPAERDQWLAAAATAAREAVAHQQLAADYAARAGAAADGATALLQRLRGPGASPAELQSELSELETVLSGAEQALAAAEQATQQASTVSAETAQARTEAAGLYEEARRALTPARSEPGPARDLAEIKGLFGQLQGLGTSLGACSSDLGPLATAAKDQAASLSSRLEVVRASVGSGAAASGAPQAVVEAEASARASADTAEIFASGTEAIAQRAQACRDRAEAAAQTPLPDTPPPEDANEDGWTAGDIEDVEVPPSGSDNTRATTVTPPPATPPRASPPPENTTRTKPAGERDPCAFKYKLANASRSTPTCTCAGYRYKGGRCVRSGDPGTETDGGAGDRGGRDDDRAPCTCRDKNGRPYRMMFGQTGCLDPPPDGPYSTAAADYDCKP